MNSLFFAPKRCTQLALLAFGLAFAAPAFAAAAKVIKIVGKVLVDGKPLAGKTIDSGATIDTSEVGAQVDLSINGKSFSRLKGGKVVLRIPAKSAGETVIELVSGELFSHLKPGSGDKLTVRTRSAVMGVRGTKFFMSEDEKGSYLCVCEGKVEAASATQPKAKSVMVVAGDDLHVTADGTLGKPVAAQAMMQTMGSKVFEEMGFPVHK